MADDPRSSEKAESDGRPDPMMEAHGELLRRIKESLPALEDLLNEASSHWGYEDPVYRFYHQSFKVYSLQASTQCIVEALRSLCPGGVGPAKWVAPVGRVGPAKWVAPVGRYSPG